MPAGTQTLTTERDVILPRPSPFNAVRRVLGLRVPTYTAHLYGEVVGVGPYSGPQPTLRIEERSRGQVGLVMDAPQGSSFQIVRETLRERGAGGGYFLPRLRIKMEPLPSARAEAAAPFLKRHAELLAEDRHAGGLHHAVPPAKDQRADGGGVSMGLLGGEVVAMLPKGETILPRAAMTVEEAEKYAWADPKTTTPPDVSTAWFSHVVTVTPHNVPTATPPTPSTTVLHDLLHAEYLLGEDTPAAIHKAGCAIRTALAKLEVVADAAADIEPELAGAMARIPVSLDHGTTLGNAQRKINRARAMVQLITDRLPATPMKEP